MLSKDYLLKNSYKLVQGLREDLRLCNWPKFIKRLNSVSRKTVSRGIWKVVKYYRKHQRIIRNTIYNPIFNNGAIEGINNKIKLIKRISYGYRNFNNFKARIMMIFSLYKGFNCQIKCNTLSLKSSAGVFQSNRLRGRVFNL